MFLSLLRFLPGRPESTQENCGLLIIYILSLRLAFVLPPMSSSGLKNKQRIYTPTDVERHASKGDCWIIRAGKVYNVTEFLSAHPGGDDMILRYAGKDVGNAMADKEDHDHSQAAYDMLGEYLVGRIGAIATIVSDG